ncbi:hypothetical protein BCR39DRAFT_76076 [Naematelia encephala]|uniref:Uncharacterized protein n=1 Tax=Naematelia encephala TaxID=71784 RepID=A0A1Y2AE45_9TREE|nr:hypothetical protein BCR39DRAFT_76076 [Naematelia encephala]
MLKLFWLTGERLSGVSCPGPAYAVVCVFSRSADTLSCVPRIRALRGRPESRFSAISRARRCSVWIYMCETEDSRAEVGGHTIRASF